MTEPLIYLIKMTAVAQKSSAPDCVKTDIYCTSLHPLLPTQLLQRGINITELITIIILTNSVILI